jgi:hypothetical protein
MHHFVYLSFEECSPYQEYVGVHSTEDMNDGYLGSFSHKDFNPTDKIILQFFESREDAVAGEIRWQKQLNVKEDPKYVNRSYQSSSKFDTSGCFWWHNPEDPSERVLAANGPNGWVRGQGPELSDKRKGRPGIMKGKTHSEETKQKMSESRRGERNGMFGKRHKSEAIQKMIDAKRGIPTNLTWWNNGEEEDLFDADPPSGWVLGRLKRKWWTNANGDSKMSVECPGEGWIPGRPNLGPRK